MTYLILIIGTAFNAGGSYFLKLLGQQAAPLISIETLSNPSLYLAVGLFALNIAGYALFLQRVQLSIGYPVYVGLTGALVLGLSVFVLRESISITQAAGILLILAGIVLTTR